MEPLSDATRRFLEDAARDEAPTAADRARLWGAISAGVNARGVSGESKDAARGATDLAPSRGLLDRVIPLPQVIAVAMALFAVGVATGHVLSSPKAPVAQVEPSPPSASVARPSSSAASSTPSRPEAPSASSAIQVPRSTSPRPPTSLPSRTDSVTAGSAASSTSPTDEVRTIVSAKRALDEGRPADALQALEVHERAYPHGSLAEDRDALRILALCASGHSVEGIDERGRFLRDRPFSAYADRVRAACAP